MITTTASLVSTLKAVTDLVKGVWSLQLDTEVKLRISDILASLVSLQQEVLTLNASLLDLQAENQQLQQQLRSTEEFNERLRHYELRELADGVLVYRYQPQPETPVEQRQPDHALCPHCCELRRYSILQRETITSGGIQYFCPACETRFTDHSYRPSFGVASTGRRRSSLLDNY